jgi:hypothetical protein
MALLGGYFAAVGVDYFLLCVWETIWTAERTLGFVEEEEDGEEAYVWGSVEGVKRG